MIGASWALLAGAALFALSATFNLVSSRRWVRGLEALQRQARVGTALNVTITADTTQAVAAFAELERQLATITSSPAFAAASAHATTREPRASGDPGWGAP